VLRRGGLGDTLLMLPLLRALRRAHPGAALHFAGVHEFARLFLQNGVVDAVLSSEDLPLWNAAQGRQRLGSYDLVVGDEMHLAHVPLDVRRCEPSVPKALQWVRQAKLECRWPDDLLLRAASVVPGADSGAMLAPGSGGRDKCWPAAHWLQLCHLLPAALRVRVVVGPVEQERDDPRRWSWPRPVEFVVAPSIEALAEQLSGAQVFVGNDSGPSHLAAMLSVPTIVLFGPTDPKVWAPVGAHVTVLKGPRDELAAITPAEVAAAIDLRQSRCDARSV
jgi:ADP-heptose:LPS heptosyltransferase